MRITTPTRRPLKESGTLGPRFLRTVSICLGVGMLASGLALWDTSVKAVPHAKGLRISQYTFPSRWIANDDNGWEKPQEVPSADRAEPPPLASTDGSRILAEEEMRDLVRYLKESFRDDY